MKETKLLKMKELSEATGVNSGTIRYYIQQGVLPKPMKTHKNMAYYDESYIDRILTIKKLQKSRYLPLDIIKTLLEDMDFSEGGDHLALLKEINRPLLPNGVKNGQPQQLNKEELVIHTGLPLKDIEAMDDLDMIEADTDGFYDRDCIRIAEAVAELRQIGLTEEMGFHVEHLQVHMDLIEFLARKEVDIFTKRLSGKPLDREAASVFAQNAIDTINRMLPIIHVRMIHKIFEEAE